MAADPLAELRDLHMPPMTLSATVADAVVALGIGLLLAWGIAQIVKLFAKRRIPPERTALTRLASLGTVPDSDRLARRAAILQDYARTVEGEGDWLTRLDARFDGLFTTGAGVGLREALYRPGAAFDIDGFDAALKTSLHSASR